MARDLIARGLIEKGHFVVTYGATFEDTANIARFNDAPYVLDGIRMLEEPHSPQSMIKIRRAHLSTLDNNIRDAFLDAAEATAQIPVSILTGPHVYKIGQDARKADLYASAEVAAIRKACGEQNKRKLDQPWLLGSREEAPGNPAILYTALSDIGPLLAAEAKWAGVSEIVCVDGLPSWMRERREVPELSNAAFFAVCNSGYGHPDTALTVLRLMPFENTAQPAWRTKLNLEGDAFLYNGLGDDGDLARFMPQMTQRFSGHTVFCPSCKGRAQPAIHQAPRA